nr:PREDICTED: guanine nucleotide-binding protein G(I)/G(S)/G(O) subunit gamma-11-like [Apteryx mantelli mantelli]
MWSDRLYLMGRNFFVPSLKVSKCSEEIKNYIEERSGEDPLVKGVPEEKNPFKEKGGCVIA